MFFNYIIVGSGIGPGIRTEECPKKGNKDVLLQVIEKGNQFCSKEAGFLERNEIIYNNLKSWMQTAEDSEPYFEGPLHIPILVLK